MARISGKIKLNGVESEFYIDGDLGWQQWGPEVTREQLGDRVPILDALVAGLSDCDEWQEDEEDEDDG